MSIVLTLRFGSRLFLLVDKAFKPDATTQISKLFASATCDFYINTKRHISQYIIDMLYDAKIITNKSTCLYDIKINTKKINLDNILENKKASKEDEYNREYKDNGQYVVMHPFASNMSKSLSIDWCVEYIKKINIIYPELNILILGGPADNSKIDEVITSTENTYNMSKSCGFLQSLYLIKNAMLSINVPSGPAHFAAFFRIPQIVIWQEKNTESYIPIYNTKATFIINGKVYSPENVYANNTGGDIFLPDTELAITELTKILNK